jgi:hypothetical protein
VYVVARATPLRVMGAGAADEVFLFEELQVFTHRALIKHCHLGERALSGEAVPVRVGEVGERNKDELRAGVVIPLAVAFFVEEADALLIRPCSRAGAQATPSFRTEATGTRTRAGETGLKRRKIKSRLSMFTDPT